VVVGNEDRKEARRVHVTRVCTNQVSAAGGLKEGLPGAIDPHWPSRGILRANLSGNYIGKDAAGMRVRWRAVSGSVLDQNSRKRLPGHVRQLTREDRMFLTCAAGSDRGH
jgi:hypothetical protein